ncbi:MAG: elongation factor P [Alphaproteobacteria bacterium]|nr:elongation factor P [Alphaproteobacteria bacterium]USO07648.1 MAG: elongation factor P [Rhodospirillales bacterium]
MAKVNSITLRAGMVIEYNGKIMVVLKHEIMQMQQRSGTIQLDLRDVRTGNKDSIRFKTGEMVDRLRLDQNEATYLFEDGDNYIFMDTQTYEQTPISRELLGDKGAFLQEGMAVQIESYEGDPLSVELPQTVTATISETEPVVKGQTAASSYKPAMLDIGVRVMVPPHIETGTRIVVKTEDGSYVERAKD